MYNSLLWSMMIWSEKINNITFLVCGVRLGGAGFISWFETRNEGLNRRHSASTLASNTRSYKIVQTLASLRVSTTAEVFNQKVEPQVYWKDVTVRMNSG